MPTVTDLSVGMRSVTTRIPLSSASLRYKRLPGCLVFAACAGGRRHRFFPAQTYLPLSVNFQDLHENLIALRDFIGNGFNAVMRQLGNVDEAVGSRQDLDECAEVHDLAHRPKIGLADLHLFYNSIHHLLCLLERGTVH